MKGLSKSRYTAFCQCPRMMWLNAYHPELVPADPSLLARFEQGNEVGVCPGLRELTRKVNLSPEHSRTLQLSCALVKEIGVSLNLSEI